MGVDTTISENGTAIFGRSGPTSQRGLPLEVDHFDRKISTWAEPFHLRLDRNLQTFWHNAKRTWPAPEGFDWEHFGAWIGGGGGGLSLNKRWSHMEVRLF